MIFPLTVFVETFFLDKELLLLKTNNRKIVPVCQENLAALEVIGKDCSTFYVLH